MSRFSLLVTASLFFSLTLAGSAAPSPREAALDTQAYEFQQEHITTKLPEARIVAQIGSRIGPAAQKQYGAPFRYYLLTETDPDAFSYYASRIYVSRGMVDFADNREELAGVMCHESAHVLHHDGSRSDMTTSAYDSKIKSFLNRAMHLTHRHGARILGGMFGAGEKLAELRYTRTEEEQADLGGATLCSQAGSNPWGLVWMLEKFEKAAPTHEISWLSDHPTNKQRIARLKKFLRSASFSTWPSDPRLGATPLR